MALALAPLVLASIACTGTITIDPGVAGAPPCAPAPPAVPMRHLGRVELDNTLRDLLHVDTTTALTFPADDSTIGFEVGGSVSDRLARLYLDTGEQLALDATGNLARLDPTLGRCASSTGAAAETCARTFIQSFGRRAFRRALEASEVDEYVALFHVGALAMDFRTGIAIVVNAMIVSPHFLYHAEVVPAGARPGDVVPVRGYEMASRLSFFYWRSAPDDALLDAAAAGELDDAMGVASHAQRLLDDARSQRGMHELFRQWLHLSALDTMSRNTDVYPEWTPELRGSLRTSMYAFLDDVMHHGDGTLATLMSARFTYADARLASVLGVTLPTGATGVTRVELPARERSGLLTQPAMMAILGKPNQSDPIHRGVFVRTRLLCDVLPPPPPDVDTTPPPLAPGLTTRQRFDMHRTQPRCAGCHQLIDPIGFGFEHYDALGRYRATESGHAIDASGEIFLGHDATGPFDGAVELGQQLLTSETLSQCVARQFFRFGTGRIETESDRCSTHTLDAAMRRSGGNLRDLMLAVAATDAFRYRRIGSVVSP